MKTTEKHITILMSSTALAHQYPQKQPYYQYLLVITVQLLLNGDNSRANALILIGKNLTTLWTT